MRPTNILFPTDFSAGATEALDSALALARAYGARLNLFHAVAPEIPNVVPPDVGVPIPLHAELLEASESHARRELEKCVLGIAGPRPELETVVRRGDTIVDTLLTYAKECAADLIVISSHGRRGFRRFLHGSVTEEVVRRAPCPALVVRRDPELRRASGPSKILAAVDFSTLSERILVAAKSTADTLGDEIDLLHVVHIPVYTLGAYGAAPVDIGLGPVPVDVSGAASEEIEKRSRQELERRYAAAPGPTVASTIHVRQGDPGNVILQHAQDNDIGMIVLGTQGLTGVPRLLLGSVCEKVLRRAPCPVLVIPEVGA